MPIQLCLSEDGGDASDQVMRKWTAMNGGGFSLALDCHFRFDSKPTLLKCCVRNSADWNIKECTGLPWAVLTGIRLELRSAWLHGRGSDMCSFLCGQQHSKVFFFLCVVAQATLHTNNHSEVVWWNSELCIVCTVLLGSWSQMLCSKMKINTWFRVAHRRDLES